MKKLHWCAHISRGIRLMEPNTNLTAAYLKKAEDALDTLHAARSRDWKVSAGYYSMYFALYAVLMRIGIRSENHDCTITFMRELLPAYYGEEECDLLSQAKEARIECQYYTSFTVSDEFLATMIREAPRFLAHSRQIIDHLREQDILLLRETWIALFAMTER
jgi:uncharacterized protein (UPF0332 family)